MGRTPRNMRGEDIPKAAGGRERGLFPGAFFRSPLLSRFGAPALSAVLLFFAFPRAHVFALAWVGMIPLIAVTANAGPRTAFFRFFLSGWVFHSLLLQWLWANIFWAGGWAVIGQQLLCVLLALFWAVCGAVWAANRPRWLLGGAVELAILWWFMELGMANLFTGFGWSALGYSQGAALPVAQWAAVGGVSLVSALLVGVNAHLALCIAGKRRGPMLGGALVLAAAAFAGGLLPGSAPSTGAAAVRVGIVQPMFAQEVKWDPLYAEFLFSTLEGMTRTLGQEGKMDMVVWPEAAVPDSLEKKEATARLHRLAADLGCCILTGYGRDDLSRGKSYNSLMAVAPEGGEPASYDKVRLAPFGEYVPFGKYLPFLEAIAFGGVSAGEQQSLLPAAGAKIGPLICFEVLFSGFSRELKRMGADCLVVVTNLAWFGASNAVMQELEIARFRAIETRLPVVHCSNTGISGVFDPSGRFTPVNMHYFAEGRVNVYNPARFPVEAGMSQRMMGILEVPGGTPGGMLSPWILSGVFLLVLCASGIAGTAVLRRAAAGE